MRSAPHTANVEVTFIRQSACSFPETTEIYFENLCLLVSQFQELQNWISLGSYHSYATLTYTQLKSKLFDLLEFRYRKRREKNRGLYMCFQLLKFALILTTVLHGTQYVTEYKAIYFMTFVMMWFQVITALFIKTNVSWDTMTCRLVVTGVLGTFARSIFRVVCRAPLPAYLRKLPWNCGVRGSAVGSGTAPQAGRPRVRLPLAVTDFSLT